jgi:hypothetical protein
MKTKYINPQFRVTQENKSLIVLNQIKTLLGMGEVYSDGYKFNTSSSTYVLNGINNLNNY